MINETWKSDARASYDTVADEYVKHIYDELRGKPLDKTLLDAFAAEDGLICDVGCGPGHVARYLTERGAKTAGLDLSEAMIERARQLNPGIEFWRDDMTALSVGDAVWGGIVAFYSIVNIPEAALPKAFSEMKRALRPGGRLHRGRDDRTSALP